MANTIYVFDADGVLFDGTMEIMGRVFAESLGKYGIPFQEAMEFYLSTGGQPVERQYRDILVRHGTLHDDATESQHDVRRLTGYFQANAYREMPQLCEDVMDAMNDLKGRRMVVSTNAPQDTLTERVRHYSLDVYFSFWFGRGYNGIMNKANHKQSIINALQVSEDEFHKNGLLVGDGTRDMEIAREWGIRGIGRPTKDTSAERLMASGAVATVGKLKDLLVLEKELFLNDYYE